MYTFEYALSEEDYLEFNLYHNFTMPAFRKRINLQRFIVPVLYMLIGIILVTRWGQSTSILIWLGIISIAWILFFKKLVLRNIKRVVRTMRKTGKLPFDINTTIVFDDEFFLATTDNTESKANYSAVEKIVIGQHAFYLYVSSITAHIVPFKVFQSDQGKKGFLEFIQSKTKADVMEGVAR